MTLGHLWVERLTSGGFAAGLQRAPGSSSDGLEWFVASTATSDRMGDVVWQRWNLDPFNRNPIALFQHDASRPVGRVPQIGVTDTLRAGISFDEELPDGWVGGAVRRRTLNAVSVGFLPGGVEARALLEKDDPLYVEAKYSWQGGFVFGRIGRPNELLELSVVSVPANSEAIGMAHGGPTDVERSGSAGWREGLMRQALIDRAEHWRFLRSIRDPAWERLIERMAKPQSREVGGLPGLFGLPWLEP